MTEIYVVVFDTGFDDTEVIGAYPTRRAAIAGIANEISKYSERTDIEVWNEYVDELVSCAEKGEVAPSFSEWLNEYMDDNDEIDDYSIYVTRLYL